MSSAKVTTFQCGKAATHHAVQKSRNGWDIPVPVVGGMGWGVLVPYLVKIFRACLATGYISAMWLQVRVVFIPKPGRNSYGMPKEFRPISLTLFLLKTMKRWVDTFLRDKITVFALLHPNQHAYQKSVNMALH
jgi:hypothetical protein